MLNDRNDGEHGQQDDHEESEYHFSDDEVSYEVETETPKSVASEPGESFVKRLTRSKRMLISVVVFIVLVFVVFKMIAPSTSTPGEITPTVATTTPPRAMSATETTPQPQATATPAAPATPAAAPAVAPTNMQAPNQYAQPAAAPTAAPTQAMPASAAPTPAVSPAAPVAAAPTAPPTAPPPQQAMMQQPTTVAPNTAPPAGQPPQAAATMPTVIPVESTVSNYNMNQPAQPGVPAAAATSVVTLDANSAKVITQFQADYNQKLSEYAAQNKSMQDQLQSLNSRVAAMESQLNQLVRALTRQQSLGGPEGTVPAAPAPVAAPVVPIPPQSYNSKLSTYSVQAIIPGRAWLKSENGETVTVAEGDVIKDLGRVTKIDPYDGIVEINTGNKLVALSYGTSS